MRTPHVIDLADRQSTDLVATTSRPGRSRKCGRIARIDATPANALDVFNHPFAYAGEAA